MTRLKALHVIGAGGHAKVIVSLARAAGYRVAGLYDDRKLPLSDVLGVPVIGGLHLFPDDPLTSAVVAIGNNELRHQLAARFGKVSWATLIHPAAWVSDGACLGVGTVVMAGAVIQPGASLGAHVIVNTSASVDHDCVLRDAVHVAPGAHLAGNVTLNEGVFAGAGSTFIPGVEVGAWTTLGAGAVVVRNLPPGVVATGVPARIKGT